MRVGDLVARYVVEQCTVIIDSEGALRAGDQVVHTTRVAVRRLRSTVRVFGELFDVPSAGELEEELGWWAQTLGEVRDLDVLIERLTGLIDALPPDLVLGPVTSTIQAEIGVARKAAMAAVLASLDDERYRRLVGLLHHWRSDAPFTPAADLPDTTINGYVKKANKALQKRMGTAIDATKAGDAAAAKLVHRARKAGKRHRYAVEAAAPFLGAKADKIIAKRRELQDVLGNHQDAVVTAAYLRDLGARLGVRSGQNGFTFGLLYADQRAAVDRLLSDLEPLL